MFQRNFSVSFLVALCSGISTPTDLADAPSKFRVVAPIYRDFYSVKTDNRNFILSREQDDLGLAHLDVAQRTFRVDQAVVEVGYRAGGQVHQAADILHCFQAQDPRDRRVRLVRKDHHIPHLSIVEKQKI